MKNRPLQAAGEDIRTLIISLTTSSHNRDSDTVQPFK